MGRPERTQRTANLLHQFGEVLKEIERAIGNVAQTPHLRDALVDGFRSAYGVRDGLLAQPLNGAPIPVSIVASMLAQSAEKIGKDGLLTAFGFTYVSLILQLDDYTPDPTERTRVEALRRRATVILDQVGGDVTDTFSITLKAPGLNTTHH